MNWIRLVNFSVVGIATAAAYAIAASGLVLTYATSGIFNFAHGAIGMMSAFVFWQFNGPVASGGWGWPFWPSLLLVLLVVAPLFGALIERVIMRGLTGASEVVKTVVTVSLMLALLSAALLVWGGRKASLKTFVSGKLSIGGAVIQYDRLLMLACAAAIAVLLWAFLRGTRMGITMRAVVDDRSLVQLCGGRPDRASMISWGVGSSLAALSGILIAAGGSLNALNLTLLVVNAYAAAVVGKLRSLPMTFVGALIIGLGESYAAGYLPDKTFGLLGADFSLRSLQFVVSPLLLFFVMVFQPQVRLRASGIQQVRERIAAPTVRTAVIGAIAFVVVSFGLTSLVVKDTDLLAVLPGMAFAILCLSLVPLTGYAGQISLAQVTFFGFGALAMSAVGGSGGTPGGVIVALAVCGVVGALIALPALRLSGIYLALATAAFALFSSKILFANLTVMPNGTRDVPKLDLGFFSVESNRDQLMVYVVAFGLCGVFLAWLRSSSWGRRLVAMKDSPIACATLGLNLTRTKIGVFALSAAIAGLAGALSGRLVLTTELDLQFSLAVSTLAVVGGIGAIGGALIGGLLLGTVNNLVPQIFKNNALGLFGFFSISVSTFSQLTPGLMGIGLGRNPNGIIADINDAYRPVFAKRETAGVCIGGLGIVWVLARSGTINNWTFVALTTIIVLGVVPLVPHLIEPIPGGRAMPAGVFAVLSLVVLGLIDWSTVPESIGMRVVFMIAAAIVISRLIIVIHGAIPVRHPSIVASEDMLGIDRPLTRADAAEAERMLGITERDFDVAR